ncbi:MAG: hypothetical protein A2X61_09390 [Ignavibacteria bacterium GWB2_35_12]|nr:MAG: hypothetical protein A2X63_04750 [Ignavibacteria bacterium GWA2_35_8]OGU40510.1 MAG: hypothetical protein A2X61_09390 [Ignavibacteria bacterium GWB2_35_12]OGU94080.1 MAG: hypothetical protein A2220_03670 [Ignavibacteria bacterium RIFOXYA2_FULL_35_10]OGV23553.1 MAG: hypothetical protein A2475_03125 [Ignavibacteria bacterium RIFOXYC2_FULL_35_21]
MLTYEESYEILKEHFRQVKPSIIEIDILDSVNHLLAEDIISDIDMPPFDNSQMDGFAIKYNNEIREWNIIGEISAGNYQEIEISVHTAVLIMTGAKLPSRADTVIPIEDVIIESNKIKLKDNITLKKGNDVRFKSEDIKKGTIAVKSGTLIKTNNIPLLAACGKNKIKVYAPFRIGLFATGDELVDIDSIPMNDRIRSSNLYSLTTLITESKMIPVNFGIVKDDKAQIKDTIIKALESDIDILISTGGVSVGKYDYLKDVIEECGFELVFWKVRVKPGKPLLFCIHKKTGKSILFFGLPGNPVSAFVSFNLFIKPFISELYKYDSQKRFKAILEHDLTKKDDRKTFVRGIIDFHIDNFNSKLKTQNSKLKTHLFTVRKVSGGTQSSGDMASLSDANCLIIFDADKNKLNDGEFVECIMI